MRLRSLPAMFICLASAVFAPACVPDKPRLNSPPQGYSEPHHTMASYYTYHNDQGMLADMSIADIHFIPHTDRLSATGQARLERYAELLDDYGGTLHYDTKTADDTLIRARIKVANAFLAEAGCEHPILVTLGGAGGRGMTAQEAAAGKAVAEQPEARKEAYHLNKNEGSSSGSP